MQGVGKNGPPVWRRISSQGLLWWQAQVTMKSDPTDPVQYIFLQGVVGIGDKGDIAVDDIDVTTGPCSMYLSTLWLCFFGDL